MKTRAALALDVFPARAGMSRFTGILVFVSDGVPRASGDEPRLAQVTEARAKCSPRERG